MREHGTYVRLRPHGDEPCAERALEELLKANKVATLGDKCSQFVTETVAELLERWLRDCVVPDKRPNTVRHHRKNIDPPAVSAESALGPAQVLTIRPE